MLDFGSETEAFAYPVPGTQVCRFCLNPKSILTKNTCCTGCSLLKSKNEKEKIMSDCGNGPSEIQMAYVLGRIKGLIETLIREPEDISKEYILLRVDEIAEWLDEINFGPGQ